MRKMFCFLGAPLLGALAIIPIKENVTQEKTADAQAAATEEKIPQEEINKKNPVKPTPEGIAAARKIYSYDCAMCHGPHGDGKGDLVESMKLTMRDWRDPTSIASKTDGELFFIITNGRGKMPPEKDRCAETMRWNFVHLIRSFSKTGTGGKPAS